MVPCSEILLVQVVYHLRDTRNLSYQDWSLWRWKQSLPETSLNHIYKQSLKAGSVFVADQPRRRD